MASLAGITPFVVTVEDRRSAHLPRPKARPIQIVVLHQPIERAAGQLGFERRGPHVAMMPPQQVAQILPLELGQVLVAELEVAAVAALRPSPAASTTSSAGRRERSAGRLRQAIARRITFCNSRTLPGQRYCESTW